MNRDLMDIGHRLRDLYDEDSNLTVFDVLDMVEHAPTSSALYRAIHGGDAEWGLAEQLLAFTIDFHQSKAWVEGGKKGPKPKQIPRPGVTDKAEKKYTTRRKSTREEVDAWMAKRMQS